MQATHILYASKSYIYKHPPQKNKRNIGLTKTQVKILWVPKERDVFPPHPTNTKTAENNNASQLQHELFVENQDAMTNFVWLRFQISNVIITNKKSYFDSCPSAEIPTTVDVRDLMSHADAPKAEHGEAPIWVRLDFQENSAFGGCPSVLKTVWGFFFVGEEEIEMEKEGCILEWCYWISLHFLLFNEDW